MISPVTGIADNPCLKGDEAKPSEPFSPVESEEANRIYQFRKTRQHLAEDDLRYEVLFHGLFHLELDVLMPEDQDRQPGENVWCVGHFVLFPAPETKLVIRSTSTVRSKETYFVKWRGVGITDSRNDAQFTVDDLNGSMRGYIKVRSHGFFWTIDHITKDIHLVSVLGRAKHPVDSHVN